MRHHKIIQSLKTFTLFLIALTMVGRITYAQDHGIQISSVGDDGVHINHAGDDGVHIEDANYGIYVEDASIVGLLVHAAGIDGVHIDDAGDNGIFVDGAGGHSINIQGNKSASTLAGHIGLVYNKNNGTNADVLALKVGTLGNPAAGNNYITFYKGDNNSLGAVEGNGNGGISYTSSGSDYAEYLPLLDHAETFGPGDIVGVHGGYISKQTANAQRVMVITDQAAMIGNKPVSKDDAEIDGYETVSFIGQVRAHVRGKVQAGDWIIASGYNDGIAVAVAPTDMGLNHQIVGRAWESSSEPEIKRINTAVGLDQSQMWTEVIRAQQTQIDELRQMIKEMKDFESMSGVKVQIRTK